MNNWLTCIVMPRLDIDTTRIVLSWRVLRIIQFINYEALKIDMQTTLNWYNTDNFLPSNQLTGQLEEVNGDSIAYEESIFYIRPNPFSTPGQTVGHEIYCMGAAFQLLEQWIQGSIRAYRDNIRKFIVYILLRWLEIVHVWLQHKN